MAPWPLQGILRLLLRLQRLRHQLLLRVLLLLRVGRCSCGELGRRRSLLRGHSPPGGGRGSDCDACPRGNGQHGGTDQGDQQGTGRGRRCCRGGRQRAVGPFAQATELLQGILMLVRNHEFNDAAGGLKATTLPRSRFVALLSHARSRVGENLTVGGCRATPGESGSDPCTVLNLAAALKWYCVKPMFRASTDLKASPLRFTGIWGPIACAEDRAVPQPHGFLRYLNMRCTLGARVRPGYLTNTQSLLGVLQSFRL
jgi:hypothetical protein